MYSIVYIVYSFGASHFWGYLVPSIGNLYEFVRKATIIPDTAF